MFAQIHQKCRIRVYTFAQLRGIRENTLLALGEKKILFKTEFCFSVTTWKRSDVDKNVLWTLSYLHTTLYGMYFPIVPLFVVIFMSAKPGSITFKDMPRNSGFENWSKWFF